MAWVAAIAAVFSLRPESGVAEHSPQTLRTENTILSSQVEHQTAAQAEQRTHSKHSSGKSTNKRNCSEHAAQPEAALGGALADQTDRLAQVVAAAGESYDMPPAGRPGDAAFATVAWLNAGVGILHADNLPAAAVRHGVPNSGCTRMENASAPACSPCNKPGAAAWSSPPPLAGSTSTAWMSRPNRRQAARPNGAQPVVIATLQHG